MRALGGLTVALLLAGCVSVDVDGVVATCSPGLEARSTAELYFGRNIGSALGVSDADWARFVDEEVTPRFPDGLSVIDAAGQWRDADGTLVREPSKVLMIVLPDAADATARLDAIRSAYRTRFRQQSVMMVRREACVGF